MGDSAKVRALNNLTVSSFLELLLRASSDIIFLNAANIINRDLTRLNECD